jgi:hypothetical protein
VEFGYVRCEELLDVKREAFVRNEIGKGMGKLLLGSDGMIDPSH